MGMAAVVALVAEAVRGAAAVQADDLVLMA